MRTIYIIGIGMGNPDTLTLGAQKAVWGSQAVIGARRMVESFPEFQGETQYSIDSDQILAWIQQNHQYDPVSVVMSGDIGFFSGAAKLKTLLKRCNIQAVELGEEEPFDIRLIPGISSLQYFCAKLEKAWDNINIVSLHGREADPAAEVQTHERTFFLTGSNCPVQKVCAALVQEGMGETTVFVGERLSYPEERLHHGTAETLQGGSFDSLSVMLVENPKAYRKTQASYGLEDDVFIRDKAPMTKCEVRSVTLSKLRLERGDCVYDVGAGTGSVSVELALACDRGKVFAIEANPQAVELIQANKEKFALQNLHVIEGMAPHAMEALPKPDKAFVGGTKGNMEQVIDALLKKNPEIRIVINAIALESMIQAIEVLKKFEFRNVDIVQLSAARGRKAGNYHLMTGQNPVFIITGQHEI